MTPREVGWEGVKWIKLA